FRLPGIGSYMSVAVATGNGRAMICAVIAMMSMIILLDQLLWRPVVVWAQKFRVEEGSRGTQMKSWFLDWLRSIASSRIFRIWKISRDKKARLSVQPLPKKDLPTTRSAQYAGRAFFLAVVVILVTGVYKLFELLHGISFREWRILLESGLFTL